MLHTRLPSDGIRTSGSPADGSLLQQIDLIALQAMARRQARVIITSLAIGLGLALGYAFLAQPNYTAQASVLIGNRQLRTVQDIAALNTPAAEAALVDSEAEALRSERVLLATIRALDLKSDPDFNGLGDPVLERTMRTATRWANPLNWISAPRTEADPAYRLERFVLARLSSNAKVSRVGKSNVLQISVTAPRARRAAEIANGIAEAYLAEQLNARFDAAKRAGIWFQKRIDELREQSAAAQNEAERFRASNNLIAANGQLVSDQQLQQASTELAVATGDRVNKQARFDSLRAIISRGASDDLVTEALGNSIITNLRQRYSDVSKRHSENRSRLGPNHEQVVSLRRQMTEFERLIFEELKRIESTYRNELDVALDRERGIARTVEELKTVASTNNSALVELRQLEQQASSLKNLYQTFLQRFQETTQQESFPINDARLISDAAPPLVPSEPRKGLLAALGLVLGLGVGVGIGGMRELSDRAYRFPQQIEDDLGVPVFGSLPDIASGREISTRRAAAGQGSPDTRAKLANLSVDHPFSSYAETLRSVKVAADLRFGRDGGGKVLGVISTLPREGKSVVSKNLASLVAMQGRRTLLIDGDLRRAGLSDLVAPGAQVGLAEVIQGSVPFEQAVFLEEKTGLAILPAVVRADFYQSAEMMSSPQFEALIRQVKQSYDYIILDLPPIGPVTDAQAASSMIDAFLFVIAWGGAPSRVVRETLAKNGVVADKIMGIVLNKVIFKKMRLYQPYGLDDEQTKLFNQYFK